MWTKLSDNANWIFQTAYIVIVIIQIFIISIPCKKKHFKYSVLMVLTFICFSLILYSVQTALFLITILFMVNANKIDIRKFMHFDINIKICFVSITLILYQAGLLTNNVEKFSLIERGFRYDFGFGNPNVFSLMMFSLLLETIFYIKRYKKVLYIGGLFAGYGIYKLTNSRTSFYAYTLAIALLIMLPLIKRMAKKKVIRYVLINSPVFLALLSILLVRYYQQGGKLIKKVDQILSLRLWWANNWLQMYKYTWTGTKLPTKITVGSRSACLDMGFIHLPLMYGYLGLLCFLLIYIIAFKRMLESQQYELFIFALYFLIMGFTETNALSILYNIILIYLVEIIKTKSIVVKFMGKYPKIKQEV